MHGEFLRLIFLQAHRETEDYFRFTGVSAQHTTDMFRYRRAAFYSGLKSKVGLIAAKTAALRVNMNTCGCILASHVASHFPPPRMRLPSSSHPSPTMYAHPACISAWGGHYTIQAVAFDLLIVFSLLFTPHTRLPLYHHSSCNE